MTDELIYGGVCPVCDEQFVDGYSDLEECASYSGEICIVEKNEDGGSMLFHLDEEQSEN